MPGAAWRRPSTGCYANVSRSGVSQDVPLNFGGRAIVLAASAVGSMGAQVACWRAPWSPSRADKDMFSAACVGTGDLGVTDGHTSGGNAVNPLLLVSETASVPTILLRNQPHAADQATTRSIVSARCVDMDPAVMSIQQHDDPPSYLQLIES